MIRKIKRDQKTAYNLTITDLLKTGEKEIFPFLPTNKKGLTLYQTYAFNMVETRGLEPPTS